MRVGLAGLVLALTLGLLSAAPAATAKPDECQGVGGGLGHPGCRVVRVKDDQFQVPHIVATADLWLWVKGDQSAVSHLRIWISVDGGPFAGPQFPAVEWGQRLDAGLWVIQLRSATSGEVLDSLVIEVRSG